MPGPVPARRGVAGFPACGEAPAVGKGVGLAVVPSLAEGKGDGAAGGGASTMRPGSRRVMRYTASTSEARTASAPSNPADPRRGAVPGPPGGGALDVMEETILVTHQRDRQGRRRA